jgi:hypothetical protein
MSDLSDLLRKTRHYISERKKLRYLRTTTTSAGSATGTTVISTNINEIANFWRNAECAVLDSDLDPIRIVETSSAAGQLDFSGDNAFPYQIGSGVTIELGEVGSFSNQSLKVFLIDSINFLAGVLPKAVLRDYIIMETVSSSGGVADPPTNMIDIHFIVINDLPTSEIPPEERSQMSRDAYLESVTPDRFLYYWRGKDADDGELVYAPAGSHDVDYHGVPLLTDFDSSQNTKFPKDFFDIVAMETASRAFAANDDGALAAYYQDKVGDLLVSKGVKVRERSMQEVG